MLSIHHHELINLSVGYKGEITYRTPSNPFEECFSGQNCKLDGSKARMLLDWSPSQVLLCEFDNCSNSSYSLQWLMELTDGMLPTKLTNKLCPLKLNKYNFNHQYTLT